MPNMEPFYDLDLPPLLEEELPENIRNSLYDPHFVSDKGYPLSLRIDPKVVTAITAVKEWPNIPSWMQSQSGVIRFCMWVGLSLFASSIKNPNSKLVAIMAEEAMKGQRLTRKIINQGVKSAIEDTSDMVGELMEEEDSDEAIQRLIKELISYIRALDGDFWQQKWIREVGKDRLLMKAIREQRLQGLLEGFLE